MKKVELARMTWKEVQLILEQPPVVFVPIGSIEQNGPQCPLGTDLFLAEYFAKQVAERTGGCVAPAISFGYSQAFQHFAGTITLKPHTLYSIVSDVCESLVGHGFDHIIIVNNHGPNEPPVEHAIREIQIRHKLCVAAVRPSQLVHQMAAGLYDNFNQVKGHGGEPITSILLALSPDDVRMDLARKDRPADFQGCTVENSNNSRYKAMPVKLYLDMNQVSGTGTTGDPTNASAERGKILLERLIDWGIDFVRHFQTMEPGDQS